MCHHAAGGRRPELRSPGRIIRKPPHSTMAKRKLDLSCDNGMLAITNGESMKAVGEIDHDNDNFYKRKTVLIDGDVYYITNDSMPKSVTSGVFDYDPDDGMFALYLPNG